MDTLYSDQMAFIFKANLIRGKNEIVFIKSRIRIRFLYSIEIGHNILDILFYDQMFTVNLNCFFLSDPDPTKTTGFVFNKNRIRIRFLGIIFDTI